MTRANDRGPHVLIIVQNLPVPLDRRVWLECQALIASGYQVSVICPKGPGDPRRQVIDGVHIYKYAPPPQAEGLPSYAYEFIYCWLRTALLTLVVAARRPFQVIQACNPPDTFWLLGRLWRLAGVKFLFDHHDLNPELYLSRFGEPTGIKARALYRGLIWLERMTFRTADRVTSTNESYRRVAIERGGWARPHNSGAQRTDTRRCDRCGHRRPTSRPGAGLPGHHGPQDGVDQLLHAMAGVAPERRDVRAT